MMLREERGASLVSAMMVLVVFLLLGTSLVTLTLSDFRMSTYEQQRLEAYYLANSGASSMVSWIRHKTTLNQKSEIDAILGVTSDAVSFGRGSFHVSVDQVANKVYRVVSDGTVLGQVAQVRVRLDLRAPSLRVFPDGLNFAETGDNRSFTDGSSQSDTELQWVEQSGQNWRVSSGGNWSSPVAFPSTIEVDYTPNAGGSELTWNADSYLLFRNESVSLYVQQGRELTLGSDIISFAGEVQLASQSGGGTLILGTYDPSLATDPDPDRLRATTGIVHFGAGVYGVHGGSRVEIVAPGTYTFTSTCTINGAVVGSIACLTPVLASGNDGILWE